MLINFIEFLFFVFLVVVLGMSRCVLKQKGEKEERGEGGGERER